MVGRARVPCPGQVDSTRADTSWRVALPAADAVADDGGDVREEAEERAGVARTIIGLVLIVGAAPAYLGLAPGHQGWSVILGGLAAFAALGAGVALAGRWLGVFQRRRENPREQQQGCLQLLVTLLTLLAGAAILYYMVYYGAGAYLRGEIGLLVP
jgi:hypothetical protein